MISGSPISGRPRGSKSGGNWGAATGVTNNKQHAHSFAELAKLNFEELLRGGRSLAEFRDEMLADTDPREPLIDIAFQVQKTRNVLRRLLKAQTANEDRRERRHEEGSPAERRGTDVTKARQDEGHTGASDAGESLPAPERQSQIESALEGIGVPQDAAQELAARTVGDGLKYVFAEADLESSAFFSVKQKGGSIIVTLNTSHPAYESLVEVLERDTSDDTETSMRERLLKASDGLKLLLMAWARYEDEQPDGPRRERAQQARDDWGRLARQFLRAAE